LTPPRLTGNPGGWGTRRLVALPAEDRFMSRGSATPVTTQQEIRVWGHPGFPRKMEKTLPGNDLGEVGDAGKIAEHGGDQGQAIPA
jgi:hypothetical protein